MNDLIRKRDIDYISAPIAPVLKGENVHYEYVAFRKQIEDISPVPAIPIPENVTNGDMIKVMFPQLKIRILPDMVIVFGEDYAFQHHYPIDWWNSPYKRGQNE